MSRANVERHRRWNEAFNTRDVEGLIALCESQVEFHSTFAAVGGMTIYHGHDGLRRWYRELEDVWGEVRLEAEAYFDLGEHTLVFYVIHGRGRQSGADVVMPAAAVVRSRDGLFVYIKGYARREDALSDLGVSEGELEPIEP
jgi:ketosteroid isomerase-like protein